jgi:hypothetical protein
MVDLRKIRARLMNRPTRPPAPVPEAGTLGDADETAPGSVAEPAKPSLTIKEIHRLLLHRGGKPTTDALKVQTTELAEILVRAFRNEQLTAAENLRLETFYICGISDMARIFRDVPEAQLPRDRWRQIYAADARFRRYWEQKKTELAPRFVKFFEECVVSPATPPQRENLQ